VLSLLFFKKKKTMVSEKNCSKPRIFYGWYIVLSSFLMLFLIAGARYSFGVIFKPMMAEFGWNRGSISFAFFIHMTLWALSLIAVGKLYDRFGAKWILIISTVFLSAGYILISRITSLWQFDLSYGILAALGMSGPSVVLVAPLISKWFEKWRGLTISLALTGNSFGQFILVPAFTVFVIKFGWRLSYLLIGLIMFLVIMTLAVFVIKRNPDEMGLKPFGAKPLPRESKAEEIGRAATVSSKLKEDGFGLREAMKTRSFWYFIIAMFVCGSGDFLVTAHLIPMVTDFGISPVAAGNMLAWFGLMSLVGVLIAGPVSDLIGNKIPIAFTFILRCFLFLMILKYQSLTVFYIFVLLFGFTYIVSAPLTTTMLGRIYGFAHIGLLTGFVTTIHHMGGGFWAYIGGLLFDKTGSYRLIFIFSAALAFIAFVCCLLVSEKRHTSSRLTTRGV
jgi:MFS family permease